MGDADLIDDDTLSHLERLARLKLPEAERESVKADLAAVLSFVAQLEELPVGDAPDVHRATPATREDVPRPGLPRDVALSLTPASRDGFIEVPRTLEES